jgi:hypothetical protein
MSLMVMYFIYLDVYKDDSIAPCSALPLHDTYISNIEGGSHTSGAVIVFGNSNGAYHINWYPCSVRRIPGQEIIRAW